MPLSAPPDYTKVLLIAVFGLGLGFVIYNLTAYRGPHVGDNIHSLPFGGDYIDGTKRINYCGPKQKSRVDFGNTNLIALVCVLILSLLIYASERFSSCRVGRLSVCHCPAHSSNVQSH